MTCYHPIRALIVGVTDTGKKKLKFVGKDFDNAWQDSKTGDVYNIWPEVLLPCGKCVGCLIDRSKQWATRLSLELMYHQKACFITLTYDDEHVPISHYPDANGELKDSLTLRKKDFQDFMKRLRRRYEYHTGEKIRFFACGEYGDRTRRPHYHAILFGVDFSEKRFVKEMTKDGYVLFRSPILEQLWPYGFSLIAEVNWNTCAYVSRYCTKKKYGSHNIYYQTFNIEPEFNLMSRRPGIASQWYEDHKDEVYINQEIFLHNNKGGLKVRPPKYFDMKYEIDYPEEMEKIKEIRKEMAENALAKKLEGTDLDIWQVLANEERKFKQKTVSLKRNKI